MNLGNVQGTFYKINKITKFTVSVRGGGEGGVSEGRGGEGGGGVTLSFDS